MIATHFDVLDYVKKAKEYGASEDFAEYNARQIEMAIAIAINSARDDVHAKDLATRRDLEAAKNQIILWVVGIVAANSIFFLAILAKGFHWF